ncbi:hypothetical protein [Mycobacteroides abscessus]|uniref:hypothetical protein n=1 Tax=Mycobacteroides abscessus TaxID=36809 RepID=UPI0005E7D768|nr:hypothetical protein [Mycobacteroides abscessus]BBZ83260.1 hypothetical protein MABM_31760 [Mycobacteroides abscessus]CPW62219.1 Uncharacterised protein [Mycobacteroides abscessus]
MKLQLAVGITALALLGAACSATPATAPSPSTHSASPLLTTTPECAGLAAEAPSRYSQYREQMLDAIRTGVPAPEPDSAYRHIPTDQPWSQTFTALSTVDTCALDGLSRAWGVDVQGWLYSKEK